MIILVVRHLHSHHRSLYTL